MQLHRLTIWGQTTGLFKKQCLFIPGFLLLLSLLLSCGGGIYHTVKPGQTMYRISRTYGVSEHALIRANGISDPSKLRVGTRLFVPGADRVRHVPVVKPVVLPRQNKTYQKPKQKTVSVPQKKPTVKPPVKPATKPSIAPQKKPETVVKKLRWPLRGKIVRSFSRAAKAGGGKGIEIAVRAGSSVTAAEAGKVIYSGDGVQGYGHLIILQHENDLFTVYGFNQRNLVRDGDFVSKGEAVAYSGVPPSGGAARLHFEVRKGKVAVNPILYLP